MYLEYEDALDRFAEDLSDGVATGVRQPPAWDPVDVRERPAACAAPALAGWGHT